MNRKEEKLKRLERGREGRREREREGGNGNFDHPNLLVGKQDNSLHFRKWSLTFRKHVNKIQESYIYIMNIYNIGI